MNTCNKKDPILKFLVYILCFLRLNTIYLLYVFPHPEWNKVQQDRSLVYFIVQVQMVYCQATCKKINKEFVALWRKISPTTPETAIQLHTFMVYSSGDVETVPPFWNLMLYGKYFLAGVLQYLRTVILMVHLN